MPPLRRETQDALDEGRRRFAEGRFWDTHEAWEEAWLAEEGDVKLALQGLIQMTAAFHKGLRMNNPRAMGTLLDASLEKLEHVSPRFPCFGGIDLQRLTTDLKAARAALETSATVFEPPIIPDCS